jgi:hypothetical protein
LRRADGIYRWWLIRAVSLHDANGKVVKQRGKFSVFAKRTSKFSSKNCQFIDFYNTYFLNGLVNPALKVAIYGSRFTLLTTSFGQNQVDLQLAVLFHNNFVN